MQPKYKRNNTTTYQLWTSSFQSSMLLEITITILISCCISKCEAATVNKNKVFLLVLDGFIADYQKLTRNLTHLNKIAENGVKAERMVPSFPSDTWPTMTSLNTGLYTESHGIIKNRIVNERLNLTFDLGDPDLIDHYAPFFTQEPLWLTNQKQGGKMDS